MRYTYMFDQCAEKIVIRLWPKRNTKKKVCSAMWFVNVYTPQGQIQYNLYGFYGTHIFFLCKHNYEDILQIGKADRG